MSEWIKCSDMMPEEGVAVDVYFRPSIPSEEPRRVPDCKIVGGVWMYWSESGDHYHVPCYQYLDSGYPWHWMNGGIPTHWMPLPSPPEDSQ